MIKYQTKQTMNLQTSISQFPKIGKATVKKLEKLGLKNCLNALHHYPFRYEDWSKIISIQELKNKRFGTIKAKINSLVSHKTTRRWIVVTEALVSDKTGSIKVVWFGQFYLNKILKPGKEIYLAGKVENDLAFGLQMVSPSYEFPQKQKAPIHLGRLVPIYPTTENISQKQLRILIKSILPLAEKIDDWLPDETKNQNQLMNLSVALEQIHFPGSQNLLDRAIHRLKFDELFLIQLQTQILREKLKKQKAPIIKNDLSKIKKFINQLPFTLTPSQKKSAWEIIQDLEKDKPMNRLLEGDVGSGKTVVAAMAILNTILNNYQVAYLAPTEILAQQHFNNISQLLKKWPIKIGLFTRESKKSKKDEKISKIKMIEKINSGEFDLIIGTHAILQENVNFKNLGLIIVDEQHRFGVQQRALLAARGQTQTETQTNADTQVQADAENNKETFLYQELTYNIRKCIFNVRKKIGLGHKEIIYQKALEEEFKNNNIDFEKEKIINIKYKNIKLGIYKPDFIIENKIILELKALPFIGNLEKRQVWNYLKGSSCKLALLVNFSHRDAEIKRIVYDIARPRESASSQRQSAISLPHFLSMTATPIPRSLALTLYGDLDLSIIDQMPPGRKPVIIKIVKTREKNQVYEFIKEEIKNGRQAFVVCPLIDPSDKLGVKSVKQEYERLDKEIFPDLKLAMLHGKLKAKEKDKIMLDFLANKIQILISTTVIEVGIDVPNATMMLIEGSEKFGLAQLWQLKGRIGRSDIQSHCFLFPENPSEKARTRLSAMLNAKNGFELAEKDLEIRGPGELFGLKQSGYLDCLKIARLSDTQIIKEAQEAIKKIFSLDSSLKKYPLLQRKIKELTKIIHLE